MWLLELSTLGVGMESIGMQSPGVGSYDRTPPTFLISRLKNLISQMAGGEGRAS